VNVKTYLQTIIDFKIFKTNNIKMEYAKPEEVYNYWEALENPLKEASVKAALGEGLKAKAIAPGDYFPGLIAEETKATKIN